MRRPRRRTSRSSSHDRLITDAPDLDYYISFDNVKVGQLQGQALVDKLKEDGAKGDIFMINGSPTDNNAKLFKQGAHSVIDKSEYKVAKEYDTPDWSPDKAQQEAGPGDHRARQGRVRGRLRRERRHRRRRDRRDEGRGGRPDRRSRPPGRTPSLAAIQEILAGEQYMTVYKAIIPEAEAAATLAVALGRGEDPPANVINGKTDNNKKQVPSVLLTPVAVTKDNVQDTIVKDGFWKVNEICAGEYKTACDESGIK